MRFNRVPIRTIALLSLLIAGCASDPALQTAANDVPAPAPEPEPAPIEIAELVEADPAPMPDPDLWQRIRDGFNFPPEEEHARVQYWLQFYAGRFDHLENATENARPFLWHVVEEIKSRGLPLELALLPIVESSYNPTAYSYAHASGMWQFMPYTARRFGLHEDWWYDGRRDVLRSTSAALDYLELLHERYDDWLLALAAYNAGEGRVDRALARSPKHDFWSLDLPRETENYVPKLLALKGLLQEPECFAFEWPRLPNEPVTELVSLPGQVELAIAAQMMGIPESELRDLNPAVRQWATHPEGPHRLLVPIDRVARLQAALKERGADNLVSWRRHRIQSGETLGAIAQRYDTRVSVLRQANNLHGNLIRAGHHLLVPIGENVTPPPRLAGGGTTYTVTRGDSLWRIGRRFGVSVADLRRWNGLSANAVLRPGQRLAIGSGGGDGERQYRVRRGDSLWKIARRFGIDIEDLKSWNDITGNTIRPGQQLRVLADRS